MHSLFEIQHLSYAYHTMQGETAALSDITFTVNTGDFVAIVGPSGCGKSAGRHAHTGIRHTAFKRYSTDDRQPMPYRIYVAAGLSVGMAQHLEKCTTWT